MPLGRVNRRGQAVLMDALIFLMIATLASVALFSGIPRGEEDGMTQEYVERAHLALLHTTIHWDFSDRNQTVSEFLLLYAKQMDDDVWKSSFESIKEVLDFILLPRFDYRWSVEASMVTHSIAASNEIHGGDVFASRCAISDEVVVLLEAWPRSD